MKVLYGIPTFTQFDDCRNAITKIIDSSSFVPDMFLIVDNSETGAGAEALTDLAQKHSDRVHVLIRRENILAAAWNDIMNFGIDYEFDYVIIANDDVTPHANSIEALVTAAIKQLDIGMWNGSGNQTKGVGGNSYSFFLLHKWAYAIVGEFDENFRPAYFEDNDYDYRVKLAGLIREEVSACTFDHIGSATMNSMPTERKVHHHASFVANKQHYIRKWGGEPGKEQFKVPFERPIFDIADA